MDLLSNLEITYEILIRVDDNSLKRICSLLNRQLHEISTDDWLWKQRLRYYFCDLAVQLKYPDISYRQWYFLLSEDLIGNILELEGDQRVIRKYTEKYATEGSEKYQSIYKLLIKDIASDHFYNLSNFSIYNIYELIVTAYRARNKARFEQILAKCPFSIIQNSTDVLIMRLALANYDIEMYKSLDLQKYAYKIIIEMLVTNSIVSLDYYYEQHKIYQYSIYCILSLLSEAFRYNNSWLSHKIIADFDVNKKNIARAALECARTDLAGPFEELLDNEEIFCLLLLEDPLAALAYYDESVTISDRSLLIKSAAVIKGYIEKMGIDLIRRSFVLTLKTEDESQLEEIFNLLKEQNYSTEELAEQLIERGAYNMVNVLIKCFKDDSAALQSFSKTAKDSGYYDLADFFSKYKTHTTNGIA